MGNEHLDTEPMNRRVEVDLDVAGLTHVGKERLRNEDQFLIARLQRSLVVENTSIKADALQWLPSSAEGTLLLVADGMGGAGGGDVASAVAVQAIGDYLCNVLPWVDARQPVSQPRLTIPGVRLGLEEALIEGDAEVRRAAADPEHSPQMGTTTTMAYILWPFLYVAHVGDSRAYLYRAETKRLSQLTTDHTLAERLREQTNMVVDDGSPLHHALWNALGGGDHGELDPEVRRNELQLDDVVLLCSDGLTKHVTDKEITQVLRAGGSAADICAQLVGMANDGGGSDNTTAVVAQRKQTTPARPGLEGPTQFRPPKKAR